MKGLLWSLFVGCLALCILTPAAAITNPTIRIDQAVPLKMQATMRVEGIELTLFGYLHNDVELAFKEAVAEGVWMGSGLSLIHI